MCKVLQFDHSRTKWPTPQESTTVFFVDFKNKVINQIKEVDNNSGKTKILKTKSKKVVELNRKIG